MVLDQDQVDIGRNPSCDIVLHSADVSGQHARLLRRDGKVVIRDLGSTNGTSVNGRPVARPMLVSTVDVIRIGPYLLQLGKESDGPWL